MKFTEITPYELAGNPFQMFDTQWALITAGSEYSHNTMTTAWGGFGVVWNVPTAFFFIRPSRYTYEFLQREKGFSLSFFAPGEERQALRHLGSHSGRDGNKIKESGLSVQMFAGVPAIAEAETVVVCQKAYEQPLHKDCMHEGFKTDAHYPYDGIFTEENFHHMFMGAITHVYKRS